MGALILVEARACSSLMKTVALNISGPHSPRQPACERPSHQQDSTPYDSDNDSTSDGTPDRSAYPNLETRSMYRGHPHPATYGTARDPKQSDWYLKRSDSLPDFLADNGIDEPRQADLEDWLRRIEDQNWALLEEVQDLQDDKARLTSRLRAAYDMIDDMTRDYQVYSRSLMDIHTWRSGERYRLEHGET